jgi:hypothetical protein
MNPTAENTAEKQRGRPFQKGFSGNPNGKPKGSLNKTNLMMRALLESEAEAITRKAIELAKDGDQAAIKLIFERLLPPRKDSSLAFPLPHISAASDVLIAFDHIRAALADGEITPLEAEALCGLVEHSRKAIETAQLAQKLTALEQIILARKSHA